MKTKKRVLKVLAKVADTDIEKISEANKLDDDLGLDSLDAVELIMEVEREFDIEIPDEHAEQIKTVHELINCVKTYDNNTEK